MKYVKQASLIYSNPRVTNFVPTLALGNWGGWKQESLLISVQLLLPIASSKLCTLMAQKHRYIVFHYLGWHSVMTAKVLSHLNFLT